MLYLNSTYNHYVCFQDSSIPCYIQLSELWSWILWFLSATVQTQCTGCHKWSTCFKLMYQIRHCLARGVPKLIVVQIQDISCWDGKPGEFVHVCTENNFVVLFVRLICQKKLIVTRASCNIMRFIILFLFVSVSVAII